MDRQHHGGLGAPRGAELDNQGPGPSGLEDGGGGGQDPLRVVAPLKKKKNQSLFSRALVSQNAEEYLRFLYKPFVSLSILSN